MGRFDFAQRGAYPPPKSVDDFIEFPKQSSVYNFRENQRACCTKAINPHPPMFKSSLSGYNMLGEQKIKTEERP